MTFCKFLNSGHFTQFWKMPCTKYTTCDATRDYTTNLCSKTVTMKLLCVCEYVFLPQKTAQGLFTHITALSPPPGFLGKPSFE